jgi:membrane fusion protein, protease secretion system
MEESLAGLDLQLKGITESRDNKKIQLETLKEQLVGMRDLAKEGYIARNRVLELERLYAQVNGAISEDVGNIGRIQKQILETRMRMAQRREEYQKEVRTQLTDVQRDAESLANRLDATDFELSNTDVKAPTDGMVVGLTVFTNGGVVSPGFNMMDVVSLDDALVVEGQVPVHLIDKVHVGLTVEMMFSAFNQNRTPHVNGEIKVVSGDRLTDPKTGMPYYIVRAQVTPDGMKKLKGLKVRPGMPVDLFIKTGERSMLNYLTKPIMDRAHNAMREE